MRAAERSQTLGDRGWHDPGASFLSMRQFGIGTGMETIENNAAKTNKPARMMINPYSAGEIK